MYWCHLVNVKKHELINRVYRVQSLEREKSYWVSQIIRDKKYLNFEMSDYILGEISKQKFKKYISDKIEGVSKQYLNRLKYSH